MPNYHAHKHSVYTANPQYIITPCILLDQYSKQSLPVLSVL